MTTKKPMFDINELIVKGRNAAQEFTLPAGKVFVRPLTDLEMNEAEAAMFTSIEDEYTRAYMLNSVFADEKKKSEVEPTKLNVGQLLKASSRSNQIIAYMAMQDFTSDITLDKVGELSGIKDLADFIRKISGYSSDTEEVVETFREES